ncbi:SGNH/GDSL hydrolase family protein [Vulcanococcus limneticus Candia 3B3]|uniref:SGNH/GDSL hydrolase family protein n=1 Tax=Vulcanococcus limneticus TaxID=2170428 RepID=UPI0020CDBA05|nr:SGNH/GDSL hydrolase family protein [Vulcanococcus limneticus]MCP9899002.1 SGNH/GDSL hydrolase family protein [Vulcanococcus limneticus Candia 3B3]
MLKVATVNIIAVFIGLLITEKISEKTGFANVLKSPIRAIRFREHRPNIDEYKRPDANYMRYVDSLEQKNYRLRTDENGYILPSGALPKITSTILFLGGSTTECLFVDEDKRLSYLVAKKLSNSTTKARSLNAGVSGNNSMHSLNTLINKGLSSKPDIIVMMHNVNDLSVLLRTRGNYWSENKFMVDESRSLIYEIKPQMVDFARLNFPVTYKGIAISRSILTLAKDKIFARFFAPNKDVIAPEYASNVYLTAQNKIKIRSEFRRSLERFVYFVKSSGSTPVLMTQMNRFTDSPPKFLLIHMEEGLSEYGFTYAEFRDIYNEFNTIIRTVANEQGILLIDLAKKIPQDKEFIYDGVHLNNKGSILASDIVAKQLKPLLIASATKSQPVDSINQD